MVTAIVSLDDAKEELNITGSDDDTELQGFIDGVAEVIEFLAGPVIQAEVTETKDGGNPRVFLDKRPVLSISSVIEYAPTAQTLTEEPLGGSYTNNGYRLDKAKGILLRTKAGSASCFVSGEQNVTVTYTVGRNAVPAHIRSAALELIRTQWQPQQSGNLPGVGEDEPGVTVLGYFVPNRVAEMLQPSRQVTAS